MDHTPFGGAGQIIMGLVLIPKRYGEAAIYDWTQPGKRMMGLLVVVVVVVVVESCCWDLDLVPISDFVVIQVGGGNGFDSIYKHLFFPAM